MAALRACLAWLLAAACLVAVGNAQSTVRPPNFFVILTDDQDLVLNSTHPSFMPNLNKFITTMGMRFDHFFASSPECCPSRVNMFQGRYAHNHK